MLADMRAAPKASDLDVQKGFSVKSGSFISGFEGSVQILPWSCLVAVVKVIQKVSK